MNRLTLTAVFLTVFTGQLSINANESLAACNKPSNIPAFNTTTYYQPANGLTGDVLKTALNGIIRGHHKHSYSCV